MYQHIQVPANGQKIAVNKNPSLIVSAGMMLRRMGGWKPPTSSSRAWTARIGAKTATCDF
jgi:hypothetical protein